MTSPTGNLTNHNGGTGEQKHNLDSGMEQCGLSEKTPPMGSECSDSGKKVLGTTLNNSLNDEKSNQVSDILAENPVSQPPAPPQHDLEKGRRTGEGLCLLNSASEHVPVHLSNDNLENKCQSFSQNVQGELLQISDAVTSFLAEDQIQSISAEVPIHLSDDNSESKNQPFSQDIHNEFEEMNNIATDFLVEDQTQTISAQVPVHLSDYKSGNTSQPLSQNVQKEFEEMSNAVMGSVVEDRTLYIPAQVPTRLSNDESENKCQSYSQNVQNELVEKSDAVTAILVEDQNKCQSLSQNELVEKSDALTAILVEDQTQCIIGEVPVHLSNDKSENKSQLFSQNLQNELVEKSEAETGVLVDEQTQTQADMSYVDPPFGDSAKNNSSDCLETKSKSITPVRLRHKGKGNSKLLKKYMLRSIGSSDRSLRSRTQEKPKAPESSSNLVKVNNDGVKRKKKMKKKRREEGKIDEFSRIKAHLKYFLNRVSYEQSLIDAYSGEGWKGYSMEKLKPEKELQRAKSAILRRKSQIRDLFQKLDLLCAEGRLPESLFDSEGEIDSEDIFCAKCQSKELTLDNDIILCDGVCDRGFHQLCLDPPLLTENIPSGDEGWLCPGCNCKDDCIDLVNDSLGTRLTLSDTWERVFPEAAAGNTEDHNLGLPSDDSGVDYNPDDPQHEEVEGGESSSDDSQYASASEKLEDSHHEDPYLGLPSEDSEDDDYNPNAPHRDNEVTEESSSSDFTSDSEDLAAVSKDNKSPGQGDDITSALLDDFKNSKGSSKQKCKVGKEPSLTDELSSLKEPDPDQEGCAHVSGKRNVERLDYKRLYDDTYKSDTSDDDDDDEDWTATTGRKKKVSGELTSVSPDGKVSNNSRPNPRRNSHQNRVANTNNSPAKSPEGSRKSSSRDKKPGFSASKKRLGDAVVQRLYKSFKENQYPDRNTKESLAQELGLTIRQVEKWFGNSRWSFRHSSHAETSADRNASQQATDTMTENKGPHGGEESNHELVFQEGNGEKSKTPSTRKRKRMPEPPASETPTDVDIAGTVTPANAQEMQKGHKMKTRKRK